MRDFLGRETEKPHPAHRAQVEPEESLKDVHRARTAGHVAAEAQQQTVQARLQ